MFILRDLLPPLQGAFSDTRLGRERAQWFIYTLLSIVVPFTSSMTSNLLRTLHTLFGLSPDSQRFYTFMASPSLPCHRWRQLEDIRRIPQISIIEPAAQRLCDLVRDKVDVCLCSEGSAAHYFR